MIAFYDARVREGKTMAQETVLENRKPPVSVATQAADKGHGNGAEQPRESNFAEVIGALKDDPMLDAMMENIRQRRREIDADDAVE